MEFTKIVPLISVVTPSLNQASFIGEAVKSVRAQGYLNYEHLVIDGMSTDGTVDLLRGLPLSMGQPGLVWCSEKDRGQSEALNKGFRKAKGDIIGWLNSDDRYEAGCFDRISQAFDENPSVDVLYGDYRMVDSSGQVVQIRREIEFSTFVLLYHRISYIPTTATFFRRKVFDEGNWLDEDLQYAMDLEFFIRLDAKGYRFKHVPQILADFRLQPDSKTCSSPDKQQEEHRQVVFATAPILRDLDSGALRTFVLFLLRSAASARRYTEKLLRGYYWEQIRPDTLKADQ